ncbi:ribosomal protein L1p/L10e family [Actinidia rufa]|uniref:Ribosomal protein L1p/L10e family n=1 Tax=Actinidia rufa TaxID=165716 RepID=A0A7J0GEJ2_9ERIC|nr:ribosomal protein L1p/L10e family [Actinidia rufa]
MAVSHLLPTSSAAKTPKPQLLDQDDDFIYLVLTLNKIPPTSRTNAHKIPSPHSLHNDGVSELCLIIDDRPKSPKLTSDAAKAKIRAENIPITKVLKLSKLKSDYKPFEAKRKLCDSYDMFFVDKRVVHLLPKLVGKQFFKKSKIPMPVDLTHKNWKEQIEKASTSALLYLRTGTCSVVRVGKASMERGEIVENVVAAVDGVVDVVPKKWAGVLPDMKLKIEGKAKKSGEGMKEEIKEEGKLERENEKGVLKKKGRIHERKKGDSMIGKVAIKLKGEKILKKSASKPEKGDESFEKKVKKKGGFEKLKDEGSEVKHKKSFTAISGIVLCAFCKEEGKNIF